MAPVQFLISKSLKKPRNEPAASTEDNGSPHPRQATWTIMPETQQPKETKRRTKMHLSLSDANFPRPLQRGPHVLTILLRAVLITAHSRRVLLKMAGLFVIVAASA